MPTNEKISELPAAATPFDGAELFPGVQSATNVAVAFAALVDQIFGFGLSFSTAQLFASSVSFDNSLITSDGLGNLTCGKLVCPNSADQSFDISAVGQITYRFNGAAAPYVLFYLQNGNIIYDLDPGGGEIHFDMPGTARFSTCATGDMVFSATGADDLTLSTYTSRMVAGIPFAPSAGIVTVEGDIFFPHTVAGNLVWSNP